MKSHRTSHPLIPIGGTFFLLALLLLAGCSQLSVIPQTVEPTEAWNMIKMNSANSELIIIDVRTRDEYTREHIPHAINRDVQSPSFLKDIDTLDRNKTYFLYCRAGNRSVAAMDIMKDEGFKKVSTINGGFNAWTRAGLRTTSTEDEQ
jgi:phage shock protein E